MRFLKKDGVVALITVIIIAVFLFSVGILLMIQSGTSILSGQIGNQADQAQFIAETGIQDALIRIARNKEYSGSYTITESDPAFDVRQVDISVTTSSASTSYIIATSTISKGGTSVSRIIRADVTFDTSVGKEGKILSVSRSNL